MVEKLVIDTDPGIDDAMAIIYALLSPGVELVGLTTVFGNVPTPIATRNAIALCEMMGRRYPVAEGAHKPLSIPPNPPSDFVHGVEGFGDVPPIAIQAQPVEQDAAHFIV